jgi:hypothetical protein
LNRRKLSGSGTCITDVSSRRPGFSISAVTRRGIIARAATIERALAARDAEIAERKLRANEVGKVSR